MNFEDDLEDKSVSSAPEREISLGTGTVFGIFFLLAIVCAAFFGFGYTMGHRSAQSAAKAVETNTITGKNQTDSPFSNFKAAPVAGAPAPEAAAPTKAEESPANAPNDTPSAEAPGATVQPPTAADGSWMVQVSATTRKPDAEALTRVLLAKGFTAAIKPDADQKFHVRVGPFASKKDADITRKLLVASGYKDPFLTPR